MNNRLTTIIATIVTMAIATMVYAGERRDIPVDNQRGPWNDTIDEDARDYAYNRILGFSRKGDTSIRIELRDGDCYTAYPENPSSGWDDCTRDRERSELREKWEPDLHRDTWYSISMFIPEDYKYMYPKQIFMQWHGGPGPSVYFQLNEDKFYIDVLTEPGITTTKYEIGTQLLTPGQWHDFVVNAVWSKYKDGKLIVYVNGNTILEHHGPTMDPVSYDEGNGPFFKFGIYRSHLFRWESEEPRPTQILYFDEYRRGYRFEDVDVRQQVGD